MISLQRSEPQHERLKRKTPLMELETPTIILGRMNENLTCELTNQLSHNILENLRTGKFNNPNCHFLHKNDDNISCASTQESTNSEKAQIAKPSFFCQANIQAPTRVTGTTTTTVTGTKTATDRVASIRIKETVVDNNRNISVVVPDSEVLNYQAKCSFMKIKQVLEENGDKKLKAVLEIFAAFQDLLIKEKLVDKKKFEILRCENLVTLEVCLAIIGELRYQHADAISSSILYFTTEGIGLGKKEFLRLIDQVIKKKCGKLSIIRKAKCFGMIKSLYLRKCQC